MWRRSPAARRGLTFGVRRPQLDDMKRVPTPLAIALASVASVWAAPVAAMPVGDEGKTRPLRLRLRPGDEWRERVRHEVEVIDGVGRVARVLRSDRVETVRVLSLVTDFRAGAGRPARDWARVLRTPVPTPGPGAEGRSVPAPYEIMLSSRGELALPPPQEARPAEDAAQATILAGLVARFAPVLPEEGLAVGEEASRVVRLSLVSDARLGPGFEETETATLISAGSAKGPGASRGEVAVLAISRRAGPQTVALVDAALGAPRPGSLVSIPPPEELDLDVLGASGDGEIRFDIARGVVLSYGMRETLGIAAKLGGSSVRRTINVSLRIERLEEHHPD